MKYRQLGRTGFEVSDIGYGAWGISGKQWIGATDKESLAALHAAIDRGIDLIDTALAYGDGKSEELVGRAISETTHRVYIATKVPPKNRIWPARPGICIEEVFPYDYIDSVQVIYNIFDQTPERTLFPACIKHKIGVLARVPFDEGALTGKITEDTVFPEGDFRGYYFRGDRKKQVQERLAAIVRDLNLPDTSHMPEIAMRFCLSHPAVSSVIPGMRSISSVLGNVMASGQGPLPENTLEVLRDHAWDRNFYA
jgi:aryl-alcohol dehydrogenase-like predicted oxidoreductase